MGVEAEAKASGRCNRASEESKTRSRRRGHQPVTKNHPNSRKWWRINRHRKRMTNHEGQPRPPSQPTNSGDTSAEHTHSTVKKRQQGNPTCKASRQHCNWSTLTQGAKATKPRKQAEQDKPRKPPPGKTAHAADPEEEDAARPLQPNPRSRSASWRQTC